MRRAHAQGRAIRTELRGERDAGGFVVVRREGGLGAQGELVETESGDVTRIAAESPTCVFGGREVIAKSNAGFNVVDLLG